MEDLELLGARVVIKNWAGDSIYKDFTEEQAINLANLPFLFKHVALMPDAHQGYGMPIGGVVALDGVISPHMVGADIGCGMRACCTGLSVEEFMSYREEILDRIFAKIPVGRARRTTPLLTVYTDLIKEQLKSIWKLSDYDFDSNEINPQLGTLGSGNHFIELQVDDLGKVWVMIHSGSRNIGKKVGDYYNNIAKELNSKWYSRVPAEHDLAFLPLASGEGQAYFAAMEFCLFFAKLNREIMMNACLDVIAEIFPSFWRQQVDVHHNYAAIERHYGKEVVVHRKGAVKAEGTTIVPGCMETASYICEGLANRESFCSHSHGAGRTMGRKEATRQIAAETVTERMKRLDISIRKPSMGDIAEESQESYKEIMSVMEAQADLVRPVVKLRPIGVIKG